MNDAYECTVVMKDGSRIVVKGAESVARDRKGSLELYTQSVTSRDVPESWLWGLYRFTRTETETVKQTIAVFNKDSWRAVWSNGCVMDNPTILSKCADKEMGGTNVPAL